MSGWSILTLPKSEQLSALVGMRTRLEGTQTSGAGESHAQEANVAEVSYGEPVIVEPEYPDKSSATRRLSRAHWGDVPLNLLYAPLTIPLVYCHINSFQRASSVAKPFQGGEKMTAVWASHQEERCSDGVVAP